MTIQTEHLPTTTPRVTDRYLSTVLAKPFTQTQQSTGWSWRGIQDEGLRLLALCKVKQAHAQ